MKNTATTFKAPVQRSADAAQPRPGHAAGLDALQPSPYWGSERIWETRVNNHNSMFGRDGRLWLTASVRGNDNPAWCKAGSDHPSAKAFPMDRAVRHIAVFDPKTKKYTFVDTCYSTHHPQFGYDANDTLWTSGGGPVVGWLNTKMFDQTGDAAKSQGWTALVLDTNGNGKRDAYAEPDQPPDPGEGPPHQLAVLRGDAEPGGRIDLGHRRSAIPGAVVRLAPGANPPETALAEIYNVPMPGFGARGADIDSKGVVWVSLGSGHMGSFDRRKCKAPLNGPKATGDHCPEGWSFHKYPGPGFQGIGDNSAESSYYSLGRSAQHVRPRQRCADVDGQPERRDHRLRQRPDGRAARAVSDGLLREGLRRPHRRSEGRMEGPRAVGRERRSHALADRGRQGQRSRSPRISSCGRIRWRSKAKQDVCRGMACRPSGSPLTCSNCNEPLVPAVSRTSHASRVRFIFLVRYASLHGRGLFGRPGDPTPSRTRPRPRRPCP